MVVEVIDLREELEVVEGLDLGVPLREVLEVMRIAERSVALLGIVILLGVVDADPRGAKLLIEAQGADRPKRFLLEPLVAKTTAEPQTEVETCDVILLVAAILVGVERLAPEVVVLTLNLPTVGRLLAIVLGRARLAVVVAEVEVDAIVVPATIEVRYDRGIVLIGVAAGALVGDVNRPVPCFRRLLLGRKRRDLDLLLLGRLDKRNLVGRKLDSPEIVGGELNLVAGDDRAGTCEHRPGLHDYPVGECGGSCHRRNHKHQSFHRLFSFL